MTLTIADPSPTALESRLLLMPVAGRDDPVCGTSFGSGCAFGLHGYHVCGEPTGHGGTFCGTSS